MNSERPVSSLSLVDRLELYMFPNSQELHMLLHCETCSLRCTLVFKTHHGLLSVSAEKIGAVSSLQCARWQKAIADLNVLFGLQNPISLASEVAA